MNFTRSDLRHMQTEYPVGDPFGGPAYGMRQDPVSAMLGGAAISAVGSIIGGNEQADAAQSAANTSAGATDRAAALQEKIYNQTREDQTPWRQAGVNALTKLQAGMPNWQTDPGYQFRLGEGLKAMNASAAARGGLQSGAALKAAQRYGQDYGSSEYGTQYNRLAALAGIGQTANDSLAAAGRGFGNSMSNLWMTNAANQGNAALSAGNARASAYGGIGNALGRINWNGMNWGSNPYDPAAAPQWGNSYAGFNNPDNYG